MTSTTTTTTTTLSPLPLPLPLPPPGQYVIINKKTGRALDANVHAAKQLCEKHRRLFMSEFSGTGTRSQRFFIEKHGVNSYLIKTRFVQGDNNNRELLLDGNTQAHVPNYDQRHKTPFLWHFDGKSKNHRWRFVAHESTCTFAIVNEANELALNGGDIDFMEQKQQHFDPEHKSPFLSSIDPHYHLHNNNNNNNNNENENENDVNNEKMMGMQWILHPVNDHGDYQCIWNEEEVDNNVPSGVYMIVNKLNGMCLDANVKAARQLNPKQERIFLWKPNEKSRNHHWHIKNENGRYMLQSETSFGHRVLLLDGNTNTLQLNIELPTPYLNWKDCHSSESQQWKMCRTRSNEPNMFQIINCSNGLALDGDVFNWEHVDPYHMSPVLSIPDHVHSIGQYWQLVPLNKGSSGDDGTAVIAGGALVGALMFGAPGLIVGALASSVIHELHQHQGRKRSQQLFNNDKESTTTPAVSSQHNQQEMDSAESVHSTDCIIMTTGPMEQQESLPEQRPYMDPLETPEPPCPPILCPTTSADNYSHAERNRSMSYNEFQGLLESLKREPVEYNRVALVSTAANHNFFTCEQLAQIMNECCFSRSERIHVAQHMIPRVIDRYNSYIVIRVLNNVEERNEIVRLFLL
jgi:hypothetical protein